MFLMISLCPLPVDSICACCRGVFLPPPLPYHRNNAWRHGEAQWHGRLISKQYNAHNGNTIPHTGVQALVSFGYGESGDLHNAFLQELLGDWIQTVILFVYPPPLNVSVAEWSTQLERHWFLFIDTFNGGFFPLYSCQAVAQYCTRIIEECQEMFKSCTDTKQLCWHKGVCTNRI